MSDLNIDDILAAAGSMETACGEPFEFNVQGTVPVGDCANKTEEETGRMAGLIMREIRQKAEATCTSDDCPQWHFERGEEISSNCVRNDAGNVWVSTWLIKLKCVP